MDLVALLNRIFFSTFVLVSGYRQVPQDQNLMEKSAFVLPFGLISAPTTFGRLMKKVQKDIQWQTLLLYLNDVIVVSKDFESHVD